MDVVLFSNYIAAHLGPSFEMETPRGLFSDLLRAKFKPGGSAAVVRRWIEQVPRLVDLFDADAVERGGIIAKPALLYPEPKHWMFGFSAVRRTGLEKQRNIRSFRLDPTQAASAASVFRSMARGVCPREMRTALGAELDALFDSSAPRQSWPRDTRPGVYRREHASILIRSERACLLFDPVCMTVVPGATTVMPDPELNAVLITHSHGDHWHIPSTLAAARTDALQVVVPQVPRATLLCSDMSAELQDVGQASADPPWGETITFEDTEVDVLPFFGEQPAIDARCPDAQVRSWGNCYRVNTQHFSALVLADSGQDSEGSMTEVVARSFRKRGPVDVILACMRDFLSPFEIGGLGHYWMALPFQELERLYAIYASGQLRSTTAGLAEGGLAQICAEAHARTFLPYAQGFAGVGKPVPAGPWGPSPTLSEDQALAKLQTQLRSIGASTTVTSWTPGDRCMPNTADRQWVTSAASGVCHERERPHLR